MAAAARVCVEAGEAPVIKHPISGAAQPVSDSSQRVTAMRKDHPEWDQKPERQATRKAWRPHARANPKPAVAAEPAEGAT